MLGRLYTFLFIILIVLAFWYQKKHLEQASKEFHARLDSENFNLPTSTIQNFNIKSYNNNLLKFSFSGNKITYYSDSHFEAEGNLIYKEFNQLHNNTITINTEKAVGEMQTNDNSTFILSNNQLKSALLPGDVTFDFNGNKGKTSNVRIDAIAQTIQSDNPIESKGPQGIVKGTGFSYFIKDESFIIKSKVSGEAIPQKPLLKKQGNINVL